MNGYVFICRSKLTFTVNGILDLNQEWNAKHEGEMRKEKKVCCFCCASGPFGFELHVPKTGYVPGEQIPFSVDLYNHSHRPIKYTNLSLVQVFTPNKSFIMIEFFRTSLDSL